MEVSEFTDKYIFVLPLEVRDYELDSEKIVNNSVYLNYMEHTRHKFCQYAGVPFMKLVDEGLIVVVRKIDIEYFTPLKSGDSFMSCLNFYRKGPRFVFSQHLFNERGEKICMAEITVVALKDGKLTKGDELASLFSKFLS